jgi:hypothetical protein
MQVTTVIIAPTFFTAGIYIILGRLISIFGRKTSPISARMYLYIFCSCDILSLVIQAIGGSIASHAASAIPPRRSQEGANTVVGGIVFQMVSITVFVGFFAEFLRRMWRMNASLGRNVELLIGATALSCGLIYVRSIFRTIELLQGWKGYLMTHESFFIGLDTITMFLAVAIFNIFHPAWFLPESALAPIEDESVEKSAPSTPSSVGHQP